MSGGDVEKYDSEAVKRALEAGMNPADAPEFLGSMPFANRERARSGKKDAPDGPAVASCSGRTGAIR